MQHMVAFDVPEPLPDVLRWFRETLEPCTEREYRQSPIMELRMIGPRSKKIGGPDGDVTVHEIVMLGFQTKGAPVPSDWLPEPCFAGLEDTWVALGPVMEFRFYPIRGGTRIWTSYQESLATVRWLFQRLVQEEIEKRYPAVGSLWQEHEAKLEMQRIEFIESSMQMKSALGGATPPARTEDEPRTSAADAKAGTQPQTPDRMRSDAAGTGATDIPRWVPKRQDDKLRWQKAYRILRKMRVEYLDPPDWSDNRGPTLDEYRDRLKSELKLNVSNKTVSHILKAGDNNWLK